MIDFVTNQAGETRHSTPTFGLDMTTVLGSDGEEFASILNTDEVWTVAFPETLCAACMVKRLATLSALGVIPRGRDAYDVEVTHENGDTIVQFDA